MATRILRVTEQPKSGGQLSFSTNYSVSKQESNPTQSGSMKPRVVVSEKGLNFIQDQKEFSEKKKADSEPGVNILRNSNTKELKVPDQAVFFRRSSIGPYSELFRTLASAGDSQKSTPASQLALDTPRLGPVKAHPLSPGLPKQVNFSRLPYSLEDLPDMPALQTSNLLSPKSVFRIRTHSNSLESVKARAPDAVKQRLISLFQSKKSTNEDPRDTSLRKMKSALAETLSQEKSAVCPSAYITKRAMQLSQFVRKEEKVHAIKQKLQQVLSGESPATLSLARHASILLEQKHQAQNQITMKEQIEIQKIQKLQVLRGLKTNKPTGGSAVFSTPRHKQEASKQNSSQKLSADEISVEFSGLLQGVENLSTRPKPSLASPKQSSHVVFGQGMQVKGPLGLRLRQGYFGGVFSTARESEVAE